MQILSVDAEPCAEEANLGRKEAERPWTSASATEVSARACQIRAWPCRALSGLGAQPLCKWPCWGAAWTPPCSSPPAYLGPLPSPAMCPRVLARFMCPLLPPRPGRGHGCAFSHLPVPSLPLTPMTGGKLVSPQSQTAWHGPRALGGTFPQKNTNMSSPRGGQRRENTAGEKKEATTRANTGREKSGIAIPSQQDRAPGPKGRGSRWPVRPRAGAPWPLRKEGLRQ